MTNTMTHTEHLESLKMLAELGARIEITIPELCELITRYPECFCLRAKSINYYIWIMSTIAIDLGDDHQCAETPSKGGVIMYSYGVSSNINAFSIWKKTNSKGRET